MSKMSNCIIATYSKIKTFPTNAVSKQVKGLSDHLISDCARMIKPEGGNPLCDAMAFNVVSMAFYM